MMAASLPWKVCCDGEYRAAFKHAEDAAVLVSAIGGEVRHGQRRSKMVWREGYEQFEAGESYDRAADVMRERAAGFAPEAKSVRRAA